MFVHYVIDAITNGVYAATTPPPFQTLFDQYIPGWREDNFSLRYALSIPNHEVWNAPLTASARCFSSAAPLMRGWMSTS